MRAARSRFGPIWLQNPRIHHVLSFSKSPRTKKNFPQPRPAQEEHSAPRTHSQLCLARSHARHTRSENKDETKPTSRFRVAPRLPLNLRHTCPNPRLRRFTATVERPASQKVLQWSVKHCASALSQKSQRRSHLASLQNCNR